MVLSLKPFGCMPSHAVRRRAVGRGLALQGHDLPARSRPPAKARSTPTAACRWRSAKPRTRPSRNSPQALEETGLTLEQMPRLGGRASRDQAPAVPGAAHEGRRRRRRELRAPHRGRAWPTQAKLNSGASWSRAAPYGAVGTDEITTMDKQLPHRPGRRLDHREGGGRSTPPPTRSSGRTTSATTPSSPRRSWSSCKRFETEIEGFDADALPHVHHRLGRQRHRPSTSARKFVQEVNAVSLAVEKLYPECGSVIELGGQDAKIIIFKEDPETGARRRSRR